MDTDKLRAIGDGIYDANHAYAHRAGNALDDAADEIDRLRALEAHVRRFVDPDPGVYGDLDKWHQEARLLLGLPALTTAEPRP